MTQLSQHFTLEELTFSQEAQRLGIDNTPSSAVVAELGRLANDLLEPSRAILAAHFGREISIGVDSGYRCPALNTRIGGAVHSAHMVGRAADTRPIGVPLQEAFDVLRETGLPFDQIIFECQAWIHLAIAAEDTEPRREALTATGHPGAWQYQRVA